MDIDETLAISLEKLKKLRDNKEQPNMEKYVKDNISAILDAEAPIREYWINLFGGAEAHAASWLGAPNICPFELSGSVVEGATTARIFQVDKDLEIEIDIMLTYFIIPHELSHLLEAVKNTPGFVRLPFRLLPADLVDEYIDSAKRFLGRHENEQYSLEQMREYISPLVIRDAAKDVNDYIPASDIWNFFGDLFGVSLPDLKSNNSLTETSLAQETVLTSQEDAARRARLGLPPLPVFSSDDVPAVHLPFWPRQASGWIIRCRVWPPHDTIQSIADEGCQVVPRTSPGGDVHSEWRLSFSRPEASLAKLRSREQQEIYYFFKVFFYRYLKCVKSTETEGKTLYSYIIKTIMLWACEELHPEDKIWASLEHSLQMLLFKLLGSLKSGFLSHYFLPEINLLERVGEDVKKQCVAVINRWINNVLMTAPFDLPEKREIVKGLSVSSLGAGAVLSAHGSEIFEMAAKTCEKVAEEMRNKH